MEDSPALHKKKSRTIRARSWEPCPKTGVWKLEGSDKTVFVKKGVRMPTENAPASWRWVRSEST